MKAFHKIAAALATLPVAGVIALTGAGVASAATCPAGFHWNDMGNGAGWCAQDASGGGTGGSITYTDKPVAQPVPQAPVMPQPPAYDPPVYAPLPPPPPVQTRPMPAPAPAPVNVRPAPAQNVPAQAPAPAQIAKERSAQAPNSVKGSEVSEIASAHGKEVSEPNKIAAEAHKEEAAEKNEVAPTDSPAVDPTTSATTEGATAPSSTPSSSPSSTPTPLETLDSDRSSEVQKATALSTFIVAFITLAGFAAFIIIRNFRNRKPALIESDENS